MIGIGQVNSQYVLISDLVGKNYNSTCAIE